MDFKFSTDEDTECLLEITIWCLEKYFGHDSTSALTSINNYYERNKKQVSDDFYHYEGSFHIAARVQYSEVLKLGRDRGDNFVNWLRDLGYYQVPHEALTYFRKHYLDRERENYS